jgi:asparagine synthase (glutamine-hydrolysing)
MWSHPTFSGLPIQFRHPLWDMRLIEYALALPPHPWLLDKRVMRQAGQGRLPEIVLTRPKTPLVTAAEPNFGPAARSRLASFVKEVPGLDRFVEPAALATSLTGVGESQAAMRRLELGRPLGLAYWLWHGWRPGQL